MKNLSVTDFLGFGFRQTNLLGSRSCHESIGQGVTVQQYIQYGTCPWPNAAGSDP